uniref:C-type lectin domain-containing protein n=1 Tax=Takifugu rubripes TaxID=31033 RepID=A0A674NYB3_TAKRU
MFVYAAPAEVEEKSPEMPAGSNPQPVEEQMAAAPAEEVVSEDENGGAGGAEKESKMLQEEEDEESDPASRNARFNFCPDGWFTHNYRCYIFVNSPMNWYSAKDHCNSLGAHLASVSSPREYSFLQQMTKTASHSTAWLGGFYLQVLTDEYLVTQSRTETEVQLVVKVVLNVHQIDLRWIVFVCQGRWLWINNEGFYYTNWYLQYSSVSNPCMFLYSTCKYNCYHTSGDDVTETFIFTVTL